MFDFSFPKFFFFKTDLLTRFSGLLLQKWNTPTLHNLVGFEIFWYVIKIGADINLVKAWVTGSSVEPLGYWGWLRQVSKFIRFFDAIHFPRGCRKVCEWHTQDRGWTEEPFYRGWKIQGMVWGPRFQIRGACIVCWSIKWSADGRVLTHSEYYIYGTTMVNALWAK